MNTINCAVSLLALSRLKPVLHSKRRPTIGKSCPVFDNALDVNVKPHLRYAQAFRIEHCHDRHHLQHF